MTTFYNKNKYTSHRDAMVTSETPLLCSDSIDNIKDPQIRFVPMGIVNMVEPIKKRNKNVEEALAEQGCITAAWSMPIRRPAMRARSSRGSGWEGEETG